MFVAGKGQCSVGGLVVKVAENKRLTDNQWYISFWYMSQTYTFTSQAKKLIFTSLTSMTMCPAVLLSSPNSSW